MRLAIYGATGRIGRTPASRQHRTGRASASGLVRLIEQRELLDPFGFLVYAELADTELVPVG
jgi:hypothetical protein